MKRTSGLAIAALAATILMLPAAASAAAQAPSNSGRYYFRDVPVPDNDSTRDAVILGGTPIMRFRVGAGGFTPHERAMETQARLNRLLGEGPIYASDITTEAFGQDAVVLVKDQLLFTADAQTAAINDATPMDLANMWADNMRRILPTLTAPH